MSGLGGLFLLGVAAAITAAFFRWGSQRDRRFLAGLFLAGFLVRALFSIALDYASWKTTGSWPQITGEPSNWSLEVRDDTRGFMSLGDSDNYSQRAWAYANFAKGNRAPVVLYRAQETGWNPYPLLMGGFYYVFGFSPFTVKWINAILGALLGPVIFGLACRWGFPWAARTAALLVSFWPSLVLWSAANLKDPAFFLCTALLFYVVALFETAPSWKRRLGLLAAGGVLFKLHMDFGRTEFSGMMAGVLVAVLCFRWARRRSLALAAAAVALLIGTFWAWPKMEGALIPAMNRHMAYAQSTGIVYRYLPDRFYDQIDIWNGAPSVHPVARDILWALPKAIWHFMAEPFPGRTSDPTTLMALPQTILWYELLPFSLWGMFVLRKRSWASHGWLVGTLAVWILMCAISMGSVGTVFRVRDMVTPFFLLYASVGLWRR